MYVITSTAQKAEVDLCQQKRGVSTTEQYSTHESATVARIVYSDPYKLSDFSHITAPNRPSGLRALLFPGNNSIAVSWNPPSGDTPPTGYIIYYEDTSGGTDTGSVTVNGASTSEHTITGRTSGAYTVRIVALSTQLPSTVAITTGSES